MHSRRSQQILGAFALSVALALVWLVTQSEDGGIDVFARSGYWIMLAMAGAWLAAWRTTATIPTGRDLVFALAIAAAGTAHCFVSVPVGFKVLSDETNLLSVSQSMYQHKTALHPTMGKFYYDNFNATFVSAPSRPLVFPFLLSFIHNLTGYQAQNAFALNAAALFTLLFVVGVVTQRSLGRLDAIAACLLVLSQPIVQIAATSGGFDILSVLLMLATLLTVRHHLAVRTPDSLAFVWMTLLIYAQVRYESIIALPLVLGYLFVAGYITKDMIADRFAYFAFGPLFLFPWCLQRLLNRSSFENPPGVPPFSISHFVPHIRELLAVNLDFRFYYPYDNLLNIAAIVLLVMLAASHAHQRFVDWTRQQQDFLIVAVLVVGAGLVIFLSHHMGKAGHPTQARFFVPLSVSLAGVPMLIRRFRPAWLSARTLFAGAVALYLLYQPVAGESRFMNELILPRQTRLAMEYLATFGHHRILTISDRSGQYAALNFGAVDFETARTDAESLLLELEQRLFDEIVVFQEIDVATNEPIEEQELPPEFQLQTAAEHQITDDRKLRIARSAPP